ncbi:DUF2779 domain-containing protein [bacterium]|nr:DUF2779 domain-containing protein [bacterium]
MEYTILALSKSDYMLFLRHPAWLWLKRNDPTKLERGSPSVQHRMDEGYEFEKCAEQLFLGAKKIGFADISEYNTMLSRTSAAWSSGAHCVIQGKYQSGEINCITDILEDDGNGYVLTEIKSSSSAKPEHELDLAFQRLVLEGAGYNIHTCRVAHVNSSYLREGKIDANKLVAFTDVTENVEKLIEKTKSDIDRAIAVVNDKNIPDIDPLLATSNAFQEWLDIRKTLEPHLDKDSIYHLPKIGSGVAKKLAKNNIFRTRDIKDSSLLSHGTAKYWKASELGGRYINKSQVENFLDAMIYPICYLDYETSSNAVPIWNHTTPYQQVPFQYSLHIKRDPNASLKHFDYLHKAKDNPMDGLLEKLSQDIAEYGSVIVWNKGFEMDRNTEMAKYAPEYEEFLSGINSRVIDLIDPFKDDMITDPAFKGSNSIKDVLPVIVPDYSYSDLKIKDGGTAASEWKAVTLQDGPNKDEVYADLIKYCKRDTEAMVLIHQELIKLMQVKLPD